MKDLLHNLGWLLILALVSACGAERTLKSGNEGVVDEEFTACTMEYRFGLTVRVVPPVTGMNITVNGDGGFTDSIAGNELFTAGERAGSYEVTFTHPGGSGTVRNIQITADECHVQGRVLTVDMDAQTATLN